MKTALLLASAALAATASAAVLLSQPAPQAGVVTVQAAAPERAAKAKPKPVTVAITPTAITTWPGGEQQFDCAVTGSTEKRCSWTVAEADGGTITAEGRYVAPAQPGNFHVVATSLADPRQTATADVTVSAATTAKPWVTGYYLGYFWDAMTPPEKVDMTAMTHLVFGRIAPGGGTLGGTPGQVVLGAGTAHEAKLSPDGMRSVEDYMVKRAHDAGRKALIMLGGAADGNGFLQSTTDARRPAFVRKLVDYMVAHDYDGIDVDWEDKFEGSDEISPAVGAPEAQRRAIQLIKDLRAETARRARYQGAGKAALVTFPGYTVSINDLEPGGKVAQWQADIANLVDQYNLMSYGIGTTWSGNGWLSWFSSPIAGATGSTPRDLSSSIDAYVRSGVPRSRIGIGIGFFGVYFGPKVTAPRMSTEKNAIFETDDVALRYSELVRMGYLTNGDYRWDEVAQSSYRTYNGGYTPPKSKRNKAGFLTYEDARSIGAKARWVRQTGLGGTILWAVNYDYLPDGTSPLMAAVKQEFQPQPQP